MPAIFSVLAIVLLNLICILATMKLLPSRCVRQMYLNLWIYMIDSVMPKKKIPDYFFEGEFERCTPACQKSQMNSSFMVKLNSARHLSGVSFILNSAYRSSSWDKSKGRSGTGYHTLGRAVDVYCVDSVKRYRIVSAAISCGLNGIGIAKNYIHLDDRPFPLIFHYYE